MPPRPADSWPAGLDATRHPNRCFQPPYPPPLAGREIPGQFSEDCLYLNIYTPAADDKKRPVMFWIHGGAYIQGSANEYDGGALAAENDVVVVIINYRLGIFGFMDMSGFGSAYDGSAALGFQDQIAALSWVRDNIADYGGDANNVTILGESAGGGSVLALLAAPTAKGLFHKAIGFSPGEVMGAPLDNIPALSRKLNVEGPDLLAKLRDLPADSLFALQLEGAVNTGANVDGTIVTAQPSKAILDSGANGIPLIVGCNKDEGSFLADVFPPESRELMTYMLSAIIGNGDATAYLAHLKELVPSGDLRQKLVRVWYDLFRASALRTAEASTVAGAGGWVYAFEVPGSTPLGVAHGSDVAFTFNMINHGEAGLAGFHEPTVVNKDIANKWSKTFATFARTGDPNGAGLPHWPQYDRSRRACLVVDSDPRIVEDPDGEALRAAYGMK
jgi:para-nitrobenzyl esterase